MAPADDEWKDMERKAWEAYSSAREQLWRAQEEERHAREAWFTIIRGRAEERWGRYDTQP